MLWAPMVPACGAIGDAVFFSACARVTSTSTLTSTCRGPTHEVTSTLTWQLRPAVFFLRCGQLALLKTDSYNIKMLLSLVCINQFHISIHTNPNATEGFRISGEPWLAQCNTIGFESCAVWAMFLKAFKRFQCWHTVSQLTSSPQTSSWGSAEWMCQRRSTIPLWVRYG